jgi:hypothetical protein
MEKFSIFNICIYIHEFNKYLKFICTSYIMFLLYRELPFNLKLIIYIFI